MVNNWWVTWIHENISSSFCSVNLWQWIFLFYVLLFWFLSFMLNFIRWILALPRSVFIWIIIYYLIFNENNTVIYLLSERNTFTFLVKVWNVSTVKFSLLIRMLCLSNFAGHFRHLVSKPKWITLTWKLKLERSDSKLRLIKRLRKEVIKGPVSSFWGASPADVPACSSPPCKKPLSWEKPRSPRKLGSHRQMQLRLRWKITGRILLKMKLVFQAVFRLCKRKTKFGLCKNNLNSK